MRAGPARLLARHPSSASRGGEWHAGRVLDGGRPSASSASLGWSEVTVLPAGHSRDPRCVHLIVRKTAYDHRQVNSHVRITTSKDHPLNRATTSSSGAEREQAAIHIRLHLLEVARRNRPPILCHIPTGKTVIHPRRWYRTRHATHQRAMAKVPASLSGSRSRARSMPMGGSMSPTTARQSRRLSLTVRRPTARRPLVA